MYSVWQNPIDRVRGDMNVRLLTVLMGQTTDEPDPYSFSLKCRAYWRNDEAYRPYVQYTAVTKADNQTMV